MSDILNRLYRSKRAREALIVRGEGGLGIPTRLILDEKLPMVWDKSGPSARFLKPVNIRIRDRIILPATGAEFEVKVIIDEPAQKEIEVQFIRIKDVFDPHSDERIYKSVRAVSAKIISNQKTIETKVLLERQEALSSVDYGSVSRVLVARALASAFETEPPKNSSLTIERDGVSERYQIYHSEALYRTGEYRFVLEVS